MINFNHHPIVLDTIGIKDLEMLRGWRNQKQIWKWCRQSDLISEYEQEVWYQQILNNDPTVKMYMIKKIENMMPVGVCGFTSIHNLHRRAEFSLYIAPHYQNKGYAKCGLKTLFDHGFLNMNLNLIWGETFEGNHALKIFEDIGMKKEGTRQEFYFKDGKYIDCHLVSVTRNQWTRSF